MFNFLERFNIPIGRWLGVSAQLHWSWVLVFLLLSFSQTFSVLAYVALFLLVFLHEFGHVFAAKRFGCPVWDVTLYPFGGVANMEIPPSPKKEAVVALAGPAVNLMLSPILWLLSDLGPVLWQIHIINLSLLFFNLIPAFPMDGGRVLRAVLQWCGCKRLRATEVAVRTGQVFASFFILGGLIWSSLSLTAIGLYVLVVSQMELEAERWRKDGFLSQISSSLPFRHIREDEATWAKRESEEIILSVRKRMENFRSFRGD
jgi:Zn-dependent protease